MAVDIEQVVDELNSQRALDDTLVGITSNDSEENKYKRRSNRAMLWDIFSNQVFNHIEDYTVKQYGDFNKDNVTSMTADDCLTQIKKYAARWGKNARGDQEQDLDLIKIAHYAGIVWAKRLHFEEELAKILEEEANATKEEVTE